MPWEQIVAALLEYRATGIVALIMGYVIYRLWKDDQDRDTKHDAEIVTKDAVIEACRQAHIADLKTIVPIMESNTQTTVAVVAAMEARTLAHNQMRETIDRGLVAFDAEVDRTRAALEAEANRTRTALETENQRTRDALENLRRMLEKGQL